MLKTGVEGLYCMTVIDFEIRNENRLQEDLQCPQLMFQMPKITYEDLTKDSKLITERIEVFWIKTIHREMTKMNEKS